MQTITPATLVTNPVRRIWLSVIATWNPTTTSLPVDLTPWVMNIGPTRAVADIPDYLSQIVGVAGATCTIGLGGSGMINGALVRAIDIFSPFRGDDLNVSNLSNNTSIRHIKNNGVETPIKVRIGYSAQNSTTVQWTDAFTGTINQIDLKTAEAEVTLTLVDTSDRVTGDVALPTGRGALGSGDVVVNSFSNLAVVDFALNTAGMRWTPPLRTLKEPAHRTVSIHGVGGQIADFGTSVVRLNHRKLVTGASTGSTMSPLIADSPIIVTIPTDFTWAIGFEFKWEGWVYLTSATRPAQVSAFDDSLFSVGDIGLHECGFSININQSTSCIRAQAYDESGIHDISNAATGSYDLSIPIPTKSWTYVEVTFQLQFNGGAGHAYLEPQFIVQVNGNINDTNGFSQGGISISSLGVPTTWSLSPTAYYQGLIQNVYLQGVQMSHAQRAAPDGGGSTESPWVWQDQSIYGVQSYGYVPNFTSLIQADTQETLAIISPASEPDAWQLIKEQASSSGSVAWFDESGRFVWWSRNYWRSKMASTPLLTLDNKLENLDFTLTSNNVKSQIQANIHQFISKTSGNATPVWTSDEALTFPAKQTTTVTLDTGDVQIISPFVLRNALQPLTGLASYKYSYYQAVKSTQVDDPAAALLSSVKADLRSTTQGLQLTVTNPYNFDISFWSPTTMTGYLVIQGYAVTESPLTTIKSLGNDNPREVLTLDDSQWRQSVGDATQMVAAISSETSKPMPIFSQFTIAGDSRIGLGDAVYIYAAMSMSSAIPGIVVGVDHDITIADDSFTFNTVLTVRAVAPPSGWVLNVAGRSVLGSTTILEA